MKIIKLLLYTCFLIFYEHASWISQNPWLNSINFLHPLNIVYNVAVFRKLEHQTTYVSHAILRVLDVLDQEQRVFFSSSYHQRYLGAFQRTSVMDLHKDGYHNDEESLNHLIFLRRLIHKTRDVLGNVFYSSVFCHTRVGHDQQSIPNIANQDRKYRISFYLRSPRTFLALLQYTCFACQTSSLMCQSPAVRSSAGNICSSDYSIGGGVFTPIS